MVFTSTAKAARGLEEAHTQFTLVVRGQLLDLPRISPSVSGVELWMAYPYGEVVVSWPGSEDMKYYVQKQHPKTRE